MGGAGTFLTILVKDVQFAGALLLLAEEARRSHQKRALGGENLGQPPHQRTRLRISQQQHHDAQQILMGLEGQHQCRVRHRCRRAVATVLHETRGKGAGLHAAGRRLGNEAHVAQGQRLWEDQGTLARDKERRFPGGLLKGVNGPQRDAHQRGRLGQYRLNERPRLGKTHPLEAGVDEVVDLLNPGGFCVLSVGKQQQRQLGAQRGGKMRVKPSGPAIAKLEATDQRPLSVQGKRCRVVRRRCAPRRRRHHPRILNHLKATRRHRQIARQQRAQLRRQTRRIAWPADLLGILCELGEQFPTRSCRGDDRGIHRSAELFLAKPRWQATIPS